MLRTIKNAFEKSVQRDKTAVLNSMVQDEEAGELDYDILTEDEKIAAGLMALLHGPAKITYGTLLTVAGIVMTFVPKVVIVVETEEIENTDGTKTASVKGLTFRTRPVRTPFHYNRHEEIDFNDETLLIDREGWKVTRNIKLWDPEGRIEDINQSKIIHKKRVETTVTGYEMAATGIGRAIVGIVEPIKGLLNVGFFSGKKIHNKIEAKPKYIELKEFESKKNK